MEQTLVLINPQEACQYIGLSEWIVKYLAGVDGTSNYNGVCSTLITREPYSWAQEISPEPKALYRLGSDLTENNAQVCKEFFIASTSMNAVFVIDMSTSMRAVDYSTRHVKLIEAVESVCHLLDAFSRPFKFPGTTSTVKLYASVLAWSSEEGVQVLVHSWLLQQHSLVLLLLTIFERLAHFEGSILHSAAESRSAKLLELLNAAQWTLDISPKSALNRVFLLTDGVGSTLSELPKLFQHAEDLDSRCTMVHIVEIGRDKTESNLGYVAQNKHYEALALTTGGCVFTRQELPELNKAHSDLYLLNYDPNTEQNEEPNEFHARFLFQRKRLNTLWDLDAQELTITMPGSEIFLSAAARNDLKTSSAIYSCGSYAVTAYIDWLIRIRANNGFQICHAYNLKSKRNHWVLVFRLFLAPDLILFSAIRGGCHRFQQIEGARPGEFVITLLAIVPESSRQLLESFNRKTSSGKAHPWTQNVWGKVASGTSSAVSLAQVQALQGILFRLAQSDSFCERALHFLDPSNPISARKKGALDQTTLSQAILQPGAPTRTCKQMYLTPPRIEVVGSSVKYYAEVGPIMESLLRPWADKVVSKTFFVKQTKGGVCQVHVHHFNQFLASLQVGFLGEWNVGEVIDELEMLLKAKALPRITRPLSLHHEKRWLWTHQRIWSPHFSITDASKWVSSIFAWLQLSRLDEGYQLISKSKDYGLGFYCELTRTHLQMLPSSFFPPGTDIPAGRLGVEFWIRRDFSNSRVVTEYHVEPVSLSLVEQSLPALYSFLTIRDSFLRRQLAVLELPWVIKNKRGTVDPSVLASVLECASFWSSIYKLPVLRFPDDYDDNEDDEDDLAEYFTDIVLDLSLFELPYSWVKWVVLKDNIVLTEAEKIPEHLHKHWLHELDLACDAHLVLESSEVPLLSFSGDPFALLNQELRKELLWRDAVVLGNISEQEIFVLKSGDGVSFDLIFVPKIEPNSEIELGRLSYFNACVFSVSMECFRVSSVPDKQKPDVFFQPLLERQTVLSLNSFLNSTGGGTPSIVSPGIETSLSNRFHVFMNTDELDLGSERRVQQGQFRSVWVAEDVSESLYDDCSSSDSIESSLGSIKHEYVVEVNYPSLNSFSTSQAASSPNSATATDSLAQMSSSAPERRLFVDTKSGSGSIPGPETKWKDNGDVKSVSVVSTAFSAAYLSVMYYSMLSGVPVEASELDARILKSCSVTRIPFRLDMYWNTCLHVSNLMLEAKRGLSEAIQWYISQSFERCLLANASLIIKRNEYSWRFFNMSNIYNTGPLFLLQNIDVTFSRSTLSKPSTCSFTVDQIPSGYKAFKELHAPPVKIPPIFIGERPLEPLSPLKVELALVFYSIEKPETNSALRHVISGISKDISGCIESFTLANMLTANLSVKAGNLLREGRPNWCYSETFDLKAASGSASSAEALKTLLSDFEFGKTRIVYLNALNFKFKNPSMPKQSLMTVDVVDQKDKWTAKVHYWCPGTCEAERSSAVHTTFEGCFMAAWRQFEAMCLLSEMFKTHVIDDKLLDGSLPISMVRKEVYPLHWRFREGQALRVLESSLHGLSLSNMQHAFVISSSSGSNVYYVRCEETAVQVQELQTAVSKRQLSLSYFGVSRLSEDEQEKELHAFSRLVKTRLRHFIMPLIQTALLRNSKPTPEDVLVLLPFDSDNRPISAPAPSPPSGCSSPSLSIASCSLRWERFSVQTSDALSFMLMLKQYICSCLPFTPFFGASVGQRLAEFGQLILAFSNADAFLGLQRQANYFLDDFCFCYNHLVTSTPGPNLSADSAGLFGRGVLCMNIYIMQAEHELETTLSNSAADAELGLMVQTWTHGHLNTELLYGKLREGLKLTVSHQKIERLFSSFSEAYVSRSVSADTVRRLSDDYWCFNENATLEEGGTAIWSCSFSASHQTVYCKKIATILKTQLPQLNIAWFASSVSGTFERVSDDWFDDTTSKYAATAVILVAGNFAPQSQQTCGVTSERGELLKHPIEAAFYFKNAPWPFPVYVRHVLITAKFKAGSCDLRTYNLAPALYGRIISSVKQIM